MLLGCAACCQNTALASWKTQASEILLQPVCLCWARYHSYKCTVTALWSCYFSPCCLVRCLFCGRRSKKDGSDCNLGCQLSSMVTLSRAVGWMANKQGSCTGERAHPRASLLGGVNSRKRLQLAQCLLLKDGFLLLYIN